MVAALAHVGRGVNLGHAVRVQGGAYIADETVIGANSFIGPNATILNDRHPPSGDRARWRPVVIGADVVIGGGATLVAGISVGDRAVAGAGAVVSKDIPAGEVWAGVPAEFLMTREEYEDNRASPQGLLLATDAIDAESENQAICAGNEYQSTTSAEREQ
jgi:acetyltransferase-like isoleucine patch superfamily enzyme